MKQLIAIACLLTAGWTWEHPRPLGSSLAAAVEHGGEVHAVGERGAIARSRDDGRTWQVLASGVTVDLLGVAATDKLVVAVGDKGTILRSRDGLAFAPRPSPVTERLTAVAIAGSAIYALALDGRLVRSSDKGDTFHVLPGVGKSASPTGLAADASGVVLVSTASGLSRSTDGGVTFAPVATITEPLQALSGSRTLYAVGGHRVVYHSTMACGSCIDATYETVALYRSTDAGRTWQRRALVDPHGGPTGWGATVVPAPPATPPIRFSSRPVGPPTTGPAWPRLLATGARGEVYAGVLGDLQASADGATFTRRTGAPLVVTSAGTLIDVATGRSTDGGASWTSPRRPSDERGNLFSVTVTPDGRAFATGMDGAIIARDASGAWKRVRNPATGRLTQIFALDNDRIVAVGDSGTILVSTDRGATFARRASGTTEHLHAVWGLGSTLIVAGSGDDRGQIVLRSEDGGATWKRLPGLGSDAGIALWGSALDDIYMVTVNGGRLRSIDRGATWTDVGKGLDGVIVGVWGSGVGDVYMIGWEGRLFHTFDRGKTWQRVALGTKQNLRAIWGRSARDIYVAAGDDHGAGTLFHSTDGGVTWREEAHPIAAPIFGLGGDARSVYVLGAEGRIARD